METLITVVLTLILAFAVRKLYKYIGKRFNGLKWAKNKQKWDVIRLAAYALNETVILVKEDTFSISNWLDNSPYNNSITRDRVREINKAIDVRSLLSNKLNEIIMDGITNPNNLYKYDRDENITRSLAKLIEELGVLTGRSYFETSIKGSSIVANRYFF